MSSSPCTQALLLTNTHLQIVWMQVAAARSTAAPAAAAAAAPAERGGKQERKDKREKKEMKKRKHAAEQQEAAEEAATAAGESPAEVAAGEPAGMAQQLVQGLRKAAGALQQAASDADPAAALLQQQMAALAACVAQLCNALAAAAESAGLPAALQLMRTQMQPWQAGGGLAPPPRPPPALHLAGLSLQAEAAAAAVERQLETGPLLAGSELANSPSAPQQHQQQQLFQQWFMGAFADCYAAEVEALQESEPPIPARVLLHCVRLAADSEALFPQHHKRLVLQAAAAAAAAGAAGLPS